MWAFRKLSVKGLLLHFGCLYFFFAKATPSKQDDLETLTTVEERVCKGTENGLSRSSNITLHVQRLKARYTNCTHIQGNLELTSIPPEADLSFLKDIRRIYGYLLIVNVTKPVLSLPNLRIVRGRNLFGLLGQKRYYSVFIAVNPELKQLSLGQLREISSGAIYVKNNPQLCHVRNTVDWNDLLQENSTHLEIDAEPEAGQLPGCLPCHTDCKTGYCWGPGRDQCQKLTKTICAKQCGNRCSGPGPLNCCHPQCAAGCKGPGSNECTACRNFANDGKCVETCPALEKCDPDHFTYTPNPDGKLAYGTLCVKECPHNFLRHGQYCIAQCPPGMQEKGGTCITCDGPCPKVCAGFKQHPPSGAINWITNTTFQQFQNCTVIEGSLIILRQSFTESTEFTGRKVVFYPGVEPSQLEQLSTIRKITGYLRIDGQHENMTDLSFLRNLETIEGRFLQNPHAALVIVKNDHLRSLGLDSLKTIKGGSAIIMDNPKLCYADQIVWSKVVSPSSVVTPAAVTSQSVVRNNRDRDECDRAAEKCHSECTDDGCWGPHQNQCLCCATYKNKSLCLSDCTEGNVSNSEMLYHSGNHTCAPCHEQCRGGCTGPSASNCTTCRNARDGPNCVAVCPVSKYSDSRKVCHACSTLCLHGCTGPGSFIGDAGCMACQVGSVGEGATAGGVIVNL